MSVVSSTYMGTANDDRWPPGSGRMSGAIQAHDWARTPLGPLNCWPQSLKTTVEIALSNHVPMVVLWGVDLIQVYNDGYRRLIGGKHPFGLGIATDKCWPEVWHINQPIYERVRSGETVSIDEALYPLDRGAGIEQLWLALSYSPLRDEAGAVAGVLVMVTEIAPDHRQ